MADPVSIGLNIALQFAIQLAIAALTPKQNTEGPRLEDLQVTTSTYGNTIPIGYGTVRTSGNVIWGRNIEEVATKTDIGKGNPFSLGTNTVYSYFATFATALFKREAAGLIKIYADGKVIFDATTGDRMKDLSFRFYKGTTSQEPDSIIEEDYPDGEVPGYRGLCYIVFNRLPLENFGNRIPQMQFVVSFNEVAGTPKAIVPRDGTTPFDTTSPPDEGPVILNYRDRIMTIVSRDGVFQGSLTVYDMETGQRLRTINRTEFREACIAFHALSGTASGPTNLINLEDHRMVGGSEVPYLITSQRSGSVGQHAVYDKWTLNLLTSTDFGFANIGGTTQINQPFADDVYKVDTSGGGAAIRVSGPSGESYYLVGCFGSLSLGVGGYTFSEVSRPQEGIIGVYRLPDLFMLPQGGRRNIDVPGRGRGRQMTRTYEGLGFTELISIHGATPFSSSQPTGLVLVRIRVDTFGNAIVTEQTIEDIDGSTKSLVNTNVDTTPLGWVATSRYDAGRDILVCTFDNGGSGYGRSYSAGFFLNSEGRDSSLAFNQVRELWRTPLNASLGSAEDPIMDSGGQIPLDGEFISTRLGAFDIHSTETGQLIERVPYTNPYTDAATGATIDTIQSPITDMHYYDKEKRRVFMYQQNDVGWIYIDPPLGRGTESLKTVVDDIVLRSKLEASDIDTTALASKQVKGYIIGSDMSYRKALEPLATVYNFYAVENAGILEFKFKDNTTDITIPEADIVTTQDGVIQYEETRGQEVELPKALYVEYFQQGESDTVLIQGASRTGVPEPTVGSLGEVRFQFPLVLSDAEAAQAAYRILYETWVGQEMVSVQLPPRYLDILPNDVLEITALGRTDNIRADRVSVGQDLSLRVEGKVMDGNVYSEAYTAVAPIGSAGWTRIDGVIGQEMTALFGAVIDAPFPSDLYAERERTYGSLYLTVAGTFKLDGFYRDTSFLVSLDGGTSYSTRANNAEKMSWGQLSTAMPPPPSQNFNGIHTGFTIELIVIDGTDNFSSTTDELMLVSDVNAAMIYNPVSGAVEYVNFRDVEVVANNKLRLSNFLRGKRGTDVMAQQHIAGAYLILMTTDTISGYWEILANNGVTANYKPVNIDIVQAQVPNKLITYQHKALMPLAPVYADIAVAGSDRLITWLRRDRIGAASTLPIGGSVPLSEDVQAYEIDILDGAGGNVVRTLTSSVQSVTYDATDATYDFGGFPDTLYVKIYQMSAQVGRGFAHEWALTL